MDEPSLKTPIHLRYWQRCLRTFLPHHYTPNDSQRMTLGFFIIAAIDLLSPSSASPSTSATASASASATSPPDQQEQQQQQQQPPTKPILTPTDRRNLRQWVLACQHPDGGFCGSPTHVFPPHQHQDTMGMGNANIAATYFALLLLAMLAEDDDDGGGAAEGTFAGVHRAKTLRWLRRLQRSEDGSFGEVVYELPALLAGQPQAGGEEGGKGRTTTTIVGGGKDMRYCYLAATIRWILRGEGEDEEVEDIDVDALLAHIRRSQTYDGGFSESFRHESHAGYAYCAVAALALLDRPDEGEEGVQGGAGPEAGAAAGAKAEQTPYYKRSQALQDGISDIPGFISFLVSRQFAYLDPERADGGAEGDNDDNDNDDDADCANFQLASLSLADHDEPPRHVGLNGRCNKVADTCYTWWVLGSLSVLGVLGNGHDGHDGPDNNREHSNTVDTAALRAQRDFLLDKTQHAVGGFGKRPGDPPDIYHSSLGLAALATMGYPGLKRFDPGLCVSADTVRKIEKGRRALLGRARKKEPVSTGGAGAHVTRLDLGKSLMDMALSMRGGGERPAWLKV